MEALLSTVVIGIICIVLGISHRKGNISALHSYHRKRVTEEDRIPFGKQVGLGTIILGIALILFGILSYLALRLDNNVCLIIGYSCMIAGLAAGLGISFAAMIKYNKGIF